MFQREKIVRIVPLLSILHISLISGLIKDWILKPASVFSPLQYVVLIEVYKDNWPWTYM